MNNLRTVLTGSLNIEKSLNFAQYCIFTAYALQSNKKLDKDTVDKSKVVQVEFNICKIVNNQAQE